MADIATILQDNAKKIDEAVAAIAPKLAKIGQEITDAEVPAGKVYFLDKNGNRIKEGNSEDDLKVPANTAKIIANGNLNIKGDIKNIDKDGNINGIEVFAKGIVNVSGSMLNSQITALYDVYIAGNTTGEVTAGENFSTKGTLAGNVSAKGRVFANASDLGSHIAAGKDVTIALSSHGEIMTAGNFSTHIIYGKARYNGDDIVIAKGNVTAKDARLNPEVIAGGHAYIEKSPDGDITAGKKFITPGTAYGKITAGDSITAKEIHPSANIDAPLLNLPAKAKEPENFKGEIKRSTKIEWSELTKPPIPEKPEPKLENFEELSSKNSQALRDFHAAVGSTYTDAKTITAKAPHSGKPAASREV